MRPCPKGQTGRMQHVGKALIRLMASVGRLHRNDKLWGAVAEALVAAYALMSANGKLTSYRPYTDVDGKDLIIDLAGSFKDIYIQVKSAIGWNRYHRFSGTVRLHRDHVPRDPRLVYVFCIIDRKQMELSRIWVVPCAVFYARAYRTNLPKQMIQFNFDCLKAGDRRWDEFEVSRQLLGPTLVDLIRSARRPVERRSQQAVEGRWLRFAA